MKVLLTGFEPFGDLHTNPTMEIIERANTWKVDAEIKTVILPVVYGECADKLIEKMKEYEPDVVVCLGVAVGRSSISFERIGINVQDVRDTGGTGVSGDNTGDRPVDRPIDPNGPDGLFATLPNRELMRSLINDEIPATISNSAGTYICNDTLYRLMHHIKRHNLPVVGGFIHVPASPDMVIDKTNLPSMSIDTQEEAIRKVVGKLSQMEG
ncbi:pyroglutamyl-peptidase I [Bacillus shivajii]|uniref:pyroglutamyl-peptidase I n=1 Tax=Bacillus shivajii TaxID=1983719 RepID=UPI001CFA64CC|nr:pyroglutamyl-peptidase I [Bacillus shivajii]UCZ52045.1 pyroglutamyl-peptidase I [Bacillus shivajii]